jgi:hypothetical protein
VARDLIGDALVVHVIQAKAGGSKMPSPNNHTCKRRFVR